MIAEPSLEGRIVVAEVSRNTNDGHCVANIGGDCNTIAEVHGIPMRGAGINPHDRMLIYARPNTHKTLNFGKMQRTRTIDSYFASFMTREIPPGVEVIHPSEAVLFGRLDTKTEEGEVVLPDREALRRMYSHRFMIFLYLCQENDRRRRGRKRVQGIKGLVHKDHEDINYITSIGCPRIAIGDVISRFFETNQFRFVDDLRVVLFDGAIDRTDVAEGITQYGKMPIGMESMIPQSTRKVI